VKPEWLTSPSFPRKEGLVTTVDLLQRARQGEIAPASGTDAARRVDVPSLASALRGLLADARMGKVRATTPGDRWLSLRIEEALRGFDDIQQMAVGHEPPLRLHAGGTATVSISASRVQRGTTRVGPSPGPRVST
jgi:hypothetical protein